MDCTVPPSPGYVNSAQKLRASRRASANLIRRKSFGMHRTPLCNLIFATDRELRMLPLILLRLLSEHQFVMLCTGGLLRVWLRLHAGVESFLRRFRVCAVACQFWLTGGTAVCFDSEAGPQSLLSTRSVIIHCALPWFTAARLLKQ